MRKLWFTFILLLSSLATKAQELHVNKTMFIGGDSCHTMAYDALITDDNGILFVGFSYCNDKGDIPATQSYQQGQNLMIGKVDNTDNLAWIKIYGGTDDDYATNVCKTYDGGYAIIGTTKSSDGDVSLNQGGRDIWLIKVDANGNLLWQKTFGSPFQDIPVSITETETHELLIFGANNGAGGDVPFHNSGEFSFDWIVVKADEMGNKIWCKVYGGTGSEDEMGSIVAVGDSYYIASASTSTDLDCYDTSWFGSANTSSNVHLLKIDTSGALIWDRSYGGSNGDESYQAMFDVRDSSLIIVASTHSTDYMLTGNPYIGPEWLIKINLDGDVIWDRVVAYPGTSSSLRHRMNLTDSGYVTTYTINTMSIPAPGFTDLLTNLLDTAGNIITKKIYGSISYDKVLPVLSKQNKIITVGDGNNPLTEGYNYGQMTFGQKAFICYLDYWPVSVTGAEKRIQGLTIYPNPTEQDVTIVIPESTKASVLSLADINGKLVYIKRVKRNTDKISIDTTKWARGTYTVRWESGDKEIATGKIVLN